MCVVDVVVFVVCNKYDQYIAQGQDCVLCGSKVVIVPFEILQHAQMWQKPVKKLSMGVCELSVSLTMYGRKWSHEWKSGRISNNWILLRIPLELNQNIKFVHFVNQWLYTDVNVSKEADTQQRGCCHSNSNANCSQSSFWADDLIKLKSLPRAPGTFIQVALYPSAKCCKCNIFKWARLDGKARYSHCELWRWIIDASCLFCGCWLMDTCKDWWHHEIC